jgi:hypothetical protein
LVREPTDGRPACDGDQPERDGGNPSANVKSVEENDYRDHRGGREQEKR